MLFFFFCSTPRPASVLFIFMDEPTGPSVLVFRGVTRRRTVNLWAGPRCKHNKAFWSDRTRSFYIRVSPDVKKQQYFTVNMGQWEWSLPGLQARKLKHSYFLGSCQDVDEISDSRRNWLQVGNYFDKQGLFFMIFYFTLFTVGRIRYMSLNENSHRHTHN